MPSRDEYAACAALGMTMAEAARALGVNGSSVGYAARRHGLVFVTGRRIPQSPEHRAAISAGVKRAAAEGRVPPNTRKLASLSPEELADYRTLMRAGGCRSADAYRAIGRADMAE